MAQPDNLSPDVDQRSTPSHSLPDMAEADARNGEPGALDDDADRSSTEHPTGEHQAQKKRENELPA